MPSRPHLPPIVLPLVVGGLMIALVLGGVYWATRPPTVEIDRGGIRIASGVYRSWFPWPEVTEIVIRQRLPVGRIRKTNGIGAGETLRGHFSIEGFGAGMLYVEAEHPPFILIRAKDDFAIVNFEDADRTRRVFEEMQRGRPAR